MKKLIIITGHYGSGKTNIAINLAVDYAKKGHKTAICDIDVVNPYFKTADSAQILKENNIRLIAPIFANTNLDVPSLSPAINSLFSATEDIVIFDAGGDDVGAVALGTYSQRIINNGYEMYYVVSMYRPMTKTPDEAIEILREIENASKLKATAIINNSSIGSLTTAIDIENSDNYAREISEKTGLELKMTTVISSITDDIKVENVFKIENYTKSYW